MGTSYNESQYKTLEDNRQKIFTALIKHLREDGIKYVAHGKEPNGIDSVEIGLPLGKTYVLSCDVVKKDKKDYVNLFKTSELIRIPDDYPKTALAEVYSLAIYNNLIDESDFLIANKLMRKADMQRVIPKLTTEIGYFAKDYVYALKQLASVSLEQMYSRDTIQMFLDTEGCKNTHGFIWECSGSPEVYIPVMYGEYFSGTQIKNLLPSEMFERFLQFANKYMFS